MKNGSDKKVKLEVIDGGQAASINVFMPSKFMNLDLSEEKINKLPLKKHIELLDSLDYRRKYQLLEKSDNAGELVRSMSAEDLYFTMEAAGRTDAMELMLLAKPDQVIQIFDITCWNKDRLDQDKLLDWFGYLIMHDIERAALKIDELSSDIIVLLLSKYIKVRRYEWTEDRKKVTADNLMTFDEIYQFELFEPESKKTDRLLVFIKNLYKQSFEKYSQVMETLVWDLESNIEEQGYRNKSDRMSDRGYPDYLTAIGMLAKIDPATMKKKVGKLDKTPKAIAGIPNKLPTFYRSIGNEDNYLLQVARSLSTEDQETLFNEMVFLGNRILVARKTLDDLELATSTLEEAISTLSLGLDYLSDKNDDKAKEIITGFSLVDIFRTGNSLCLDLRKKARNFHNKHIEQNKVKTMGLLSTNTKGVVSSLLNNPPLYYPIEDGDELIPRYFSSMAELNRADFMVGRIDFMFDLHFRILALDTKQVFSGRVDLSLDPIDPDIKFLKIFMTAFAQNFVGNESDYVGLSTDEFERFIRNYVEKSADAYQVTGTLYQDLTSWISAYTANENDDYKEMAKSWVILAGDVFDKLVKDISGLSRGEAISLSQILLLS